MAAPILPRPASDRRDPSSPPDDIVIRSQAAPPPVADLSSGEKPRWMFAAATGLGLIVLGTLIAALSWLRAPVIVLKDSPEFVKALDIWFPVITAHPYTPRTLKRFLNRVRFVAARMGDPKPERSRLDTLLRWLDARLGSGASSTPSVSTTIAEHGNSVAIPAAETTKPAQTVERQQAIGLQSAGITPKRCATTNSGDGAPRRHGRRLLRPREVRRPLAQ